MTYIFYLISISSTFRIVLTIIGFLLLVLLLYVLYRNTNLKALKQKKLIAGLTFVAVLAFILPLLTSGYPSFVKTYGPSIGPELPLNKILAFFKSNKKYLASIVADPNLTVDTTSTTSSEVIKIYLEAKEVISEVAPGTKIAYWTYNDTVPGPFIRIKEGDKVELTLKNHPDSLNDHDIDLHAVTGPGGGAVLTGVKPGETKTMRFKALNPGLYVYHCAHGNASVHMAHGMYGMILVEPKEGLPHVDKEFYVMQGEIYTAGPLGTKGLRAYDAEKLMNGNPTYVIFNGKTGSLVDNMKAKVGEKVRIYVGNGGVNQISSFHVIGEIFDTVYAEGGLGEGVVPLKNIQTTIVPAGGSSIVEFKLDVPGKYILVDHALARMNKGAWGVLTVEGEQQKDIFDGDFSNTSHDHGH